MSTSYNTAPYAEMEDHFRLAVLKAIEVEMAYNGMRAVLPTFDGRIRPYLWHLDAKTVEFGCKVDVSYEVDLDPTAEDAPDDVRQVFTYNIVLGVDTRGIMVKLENSPTTVVSCEMAVAPVVDGRKESLDPESIILRHVGHVDVNGVKFIAGDFASALAHVVVHAAHVVNGRIGFPV